MSNSDDLDPRPLDSRNRVSVPPEVREALGVEPGDYVVFKVRDRKAVMQKVEWQVRE